MAYELIYTSAPQGVLRGSSGFCVVACTKGMGPRLMLLLESLSAYKPLYPHYAENAWDNPVSRSHYICDINGEEQHILSRICFNGVDYTQRSNKLASHLILNRNECVTAAGGPASLFLHEELFKDASWQIKTEQFLQQRSIPATAAQSGVCSTWAAVMGDAGWGGVLAQSFLNEPNRNIYIAYRPYQHNLIQMLISEAIALLPAHLRWQVTFNTYFVNLPAGMKCSWRCCPVDTEAVIAARRSPQNIIIDISEPKPVTVQGELVDAARTGVLPDAFLQKQESVQPEQAAAAPQPERVRLVAKTMPADHKIVPELRVPEFENNFATMNMPVMDVPVYQRKKSKLLLILAAVFILAAGALVGILVICNTLAASEFEKVLADCSKKIAILEEISADFQMMQKRPLRKMSSKELEEKRETLVKWKETVAGIKKIASDYKRKHSKRSKAKDNDKNIYPGELVIECNAVLDKIDNMLAEIDEAARKKKRPEAEKKKKDEANKKSAPAASGKKASGDAAKKSAATKKTPVAVKAVKAENARILWLRRRELFDKPSVAVRVGNVPGEKIFVKSLDDNDNKIQKIGGTFEYITYHNHREVKATLLLAYSNGVVTLQKRGSSWIPADLRLTIVCGEQEFPLYFKLGFSTLYFKNVKCSIEIKNSVPRISVSGVMNLSKIGFFTGSGGKCETLPELVVEIDDNKYLLGDNFKAIISDGSVRRFGREVKKLQEVADDIKLTPFRMLDGCADDEKVKDFIKQREALLKKRGDALRKADANSTAEVNKCDNALKILNDKVTEYILQNIPLNKLNVGLPAEKRTHVEALANIRQEQQKYISDLQKKAKSAKIYLKYAGQYYLQEKI